MTIKVYDTLYNRGFDEYRTLTISESCHASAPYVSDEVLFSESTLEVGGCSTSLAKEEARRVHPSYRFGAPVVRDKS